MSTCPERTGKLNCGCCGNVELHCVQDAGHDPAAGHLCLLEEEVEGYCRDIWIRWHRADPPGQVQ